MTDEVMTMTLFRHIKIVKIQILKTDVISSQRHHRLQTKTNAPQVSQTFKGKYNEHHVLCLCCAPYPSLTIPRVFVVVRRRSNNVHFLYLPNLKTLLFNFLSDMIHLNDSKSWATNRSPVSSRQPNVIDLQSTTYQTIRVVLTTIHTISICLFSLTHETT